MASNRSGSVSSAYTMMIQSGKPPYSTTKIMLYAIPIKSPLKTIRLAIATCSRTKYLATNTPVAVPSPTNGMKAIKFTPSASVVASASRSPSRPTIIMMDAKQTASATTETPAGQPK